MEGNVGAVVDKVAREGLSDGVIPSRDVNAEGQVTRAKVQRQASPCGRDGEWAV